MKKTLLALSVAALAAGSAQAYNFHIDQTGTDVDFYGSLRAKWESTSNKTNYVNGDDAKIILIQRCKVKKRCAPPSEISN